MEKIKHAWSRNLAELFLVGILFFVVTVPFRQFFQVMEVTEVRPAGAMNPLSGLLLGLPGIFGCAIGNLMADIISGYSPEMLVLGFLVQIIYGLVPWLIWKRFRWQIRLDTSDAILRYMAVMLGDSLLTAFLLGLSMAITGVGEIFSVATLMIFLNDFVFCMILGIPILLLYTSRTIKEKGGKLSLNEHFILIFLILAILSAAMIGIIAYKESAPASTSLLELWNRVYIYMSINLFIFCVVIVCFVRYTEKNITIPMEKLAKVAREYTVTEKDGTLDNQYIIRECGKYLHIHGEAGNLAEAFCDLAGNLEEYIANFSKITAEKERIGAELSVAAQIQKDMLPNSSLTFPERKEFSVYASMNPAKEVGGDFYDFFMIDDSHLALVIADVSGKGIPAALFMVISKTLLKNHALMGESPKEILMNVNEQLCENNQAQMFVTVWVAILDIKTGKLTAANAGHEYPAIQKSGGEFTLYKDTHGFVLAGMEHMKYREYEVQLEPGDTIFVYTDGVTEAADETEQLYGTERLIHALNLQKGVSPKELLYGVQKDIDMFVGDTIQFDDITMLAMTYWGCKDQEKIITVPARRENWGEVSMFLESQLKRFGCSPEEIFKLLIAAEELYINISSYAYPERTGEAEIKLQLLQAPKRVCITFTDQGIPYNPLERMAPDTTLPVDERGIGGLGIHMVRTSMDHVQYEFKDGCNIITVEKILY